MFPIENSKTMSVTEFQSLRNFANFRSSRGGQFNGVSMMILSMKSNFFYSVMIMHIAFYKPISSFLS